MLSFLFASQLSEEDHNAFMKAQVFLTLWMGLSVTLVLVANSQIELAL